MKNEQNKKRFTVITNPISNKDNDDIDNNIDNENYIKKRKLMYQTNPLREQLVQFVNEEAGKRFSVEDLLKW